MVKSIRATHHRIQDVGARSPHWQTRVDISQKNYGRHNATVILKLQMIRAGESLPNLDLCFANSAQQLGLATRSSRMLSESNRIKKPMLKMDTPIWITCLNKRCPWLTTLSKLWSLLGAEKDDKIKVLNTIKASAKEQKGLGYSIPRLEAEKAMAWELELLMDWVAQHWRWAHLNSQVGR